VAFANDAENKRLTFYIMSHNGVEGFWF